METFDARWPRFCTCADGPRPLQVCERFLRALGRRPRAAAYWADSGNELPPLGRCVAIWRRRVRDSYTGNFDEASAAACIEAARLGFGRSAFAREKYYGQLWYRVLSVTRLFAARIDSSGGRFDVPFEASRRKRRFDGRPLRPQRSKKMEARCFGSVSRRNAEAALRDRSRSVRRDLPAFEAVYGITRCHRSFRDDAVRPRIARRSAGLAASS